MEAITIEAKVRNLTKKGPSKRYRKEGFIPSVLYGQGKNLNLLIEGKSFNKLLPRLTKSTLINLEVDNKEKYEVLIKDYDKNYATDQFIHIDFFELSKDKSVHIRIPLHFTGNPIGIRDGGVLVKHLVELDIECLPINIVSFLEFNIEHLKMNDTMHVRDLKIDESKYRIRTHMDEVVVHISGASTEEEEVKPEATLEVSETTTTASADAKSDKDKTTNE